jgi:hypothetical protein
MPICHSGCVFSILLTERLPDPDFRVMTPCGWPYMLLSCNGMFVQIHPYGRFEPWNETGLDPRFRRHERGALDDEQP